MGQYYYVVNLDKKEYLEPHSFNDGAKLMEFGSSGGGTMAGLAILLANSNGRGGGDCRSNSKLIGSWAGDRIVIAGDYAKAGDAGEDMPSEVTGVDILYSKCIAGEYKDISLAILKVLEEDERG